MKFEWDEAKAAAMKKPRKTRPITKLIRPTPEEDEQINAGIAADPDTWELTYEDIKSMRPMSETHPELLEAIRRSRGKQKSPTKKATSIRAWLAGTYRPGLAGPRRETSGEQGAEEA